MLTITAKDRRALAIGVVCIASLVAVGKGVPAWRRWNAQQQRNAAARVQQVAIAEQGIGELARMRDSVAARTARGSALLSHLLTATSAPQAAAMLATTLAAIADEAGIRVFTLSVRPDSAARNGFARVAVRVNGAGDVDGLTRYLRHVESDSLLLAVRELTVNQSAPGGADSTAEVLQFDVSVEALAHIDTTHGP